VDNYTDNAVVIPRPLRGKEIALTVKMHQ
jgi:hypothetical protein